jgi:hypothetical protein
MIRRIKKNPLKKRKRTGRFTKQINRYFIKNGFFTMLPDLQDTKQLDHKTQDKNTSNQQIDSQAAAERTRVHVKVSVFSTVTSGSIAEYE